MISGFVFLKRCNFFLNVIFNFPGTGITIIYGPSGSGKSTFLKFLAGILNIKDGFFSFNGVCMQNYLFFINSYYRNFGYVAQEFIFFPNLSIIRNILFSYSRTKFKNRFIDVKEVFDVFNLYFILHKTYSKLSGGERQRIALARAILSNPDCLLLDEPVSALDKIAATEFLSYLWYLNLRYRIPIILISHNMIELNLVANCYFEIC